MHILSPFLHSRFFLFFSQDAFLRRLLLPEALFHFFLPPGNLDHAQQRMFISIVLKELR